MKKTMWMLAVGVFGAMMLSAEAVDVKQTEQPTREYFEAKAKKHEAEAARLSQSRNYNPMAAKWPGLANGPVEYHKQAAAKAWRAADAAGQATE